MTRTTEGEQTINYTEQFFCKKEDCGAYQQCRIVDNHKTVKANCVVCNEPIRNQALVNTGVIPD